MILYLCHDIGGNTYLDAMKLRHFQDLIQCMGIRCSLPLVGALLPAISLAIPLMARESSSSFRNSLVFDALIRGTNEAVHRFLCDHHCKIIHLTAAGLFFENPVIECRDLGNHISDAGVNELLRSGTDHLGIHDNAISQSGRDRSTLSLHQKGCAGTGKAVA